MSFSSIINKILGIEHALAPTVGLFFPPLLAVDAIVSKVQSAIVTVEANNPVDGQGQVKSQAVISDFEAGLEVAQSISRARGKLLTYDGDALQAAINGFTQGYNNMAKVKASFKEVDLPPATPAGAGT